SSSHQPTLWRVATYSAPGFPSPHTSFTASPDASGLGALFLRALDHLGLAALGLGRLLGARLRDAGLRRDHAADRAIRILCRLDALGKLRIAHVLRVADLHPLDVHLDELGDVVGEAADLELRERVLHEPARAHAGRLPDETDRYLYRHLVTGVDLNEVHVEDRGPVGVTLHLARECLDGPTLPIDLELYDRALQVDPLHQQLELMRVHRQGAGLLTPAVQDARNPARRAQLARCARPPRFPLLRRQFGLCHHDISFSRTADGPTRSDAYSGSLAPAGPRPRARAASETACPLAAR